MKFVIKDHLEMIPDILSVIEKMTKDEGIFLIVSNELFILKLNLKFILSIDKLMRFDTVSTIGYLCTVFHEHENLKSYIHSFLLPAIIRALSDPAEQVCLLYIYCILIKLIKSI